MDRELNRALKGYARRHRRELGAHHWLISDYTSGRRFSPIQKLIYSTAARDTELAGRVEDFSTRSIGGIAGTRRMITRAASVRLGWPGDLVGFDQTIDGQGRRQVVQCCGAMPDESPDFGEFGLAPACARLPTEWRVLMGMGFRCDRREPMSISASGGECRGDFHSADVCPCRPPSSVDGTA